MLSLTSEIRTPWHRVPAGAKLLALLAATVLAFWLSTPLQAGAFLVAVCALYLPGGARFLRTGGAFTRARRARRLPTAVFREG